MALQAKVLVFHGLLQRFDQSFFLREWPFRYISGLFHRLLILLTASNFQKSVDNIADLGQMEVFVCGIPGGLKIIFQYRSEKGLEIRKNRRIGSMLAGIGQQGIFVSICPPCFRIRL